MRKLLVLFAWALLAIACNSPAASNKAPVVAATPANSSGNATRSSLNENAYTSAGNSSLGRIVKPSVGKTASEAKLWQDKEIDARLKKLMGADYATMKKSWNTETPVKKFGDYLMMTGCEKRNCPDNQYIIFMDTSDDNINVVHIGKGILIQEWKEYGQVALPPPFAEELTKMKSRK